jgi:hypothetical protein
MSLLSSVRAQQLTIVVVVVVVLLCCCVVVLFSRSKVDLWCNNSFGGGECVSHHEFGCCCALCWVGCTRKER